MKEWGVCDNVNPNANLNGWMVMGYWLWVIEAMRGDNVNPNAN